MPAGWVEARLGDYATFLKGSGLSKAQLVENGEQSCIHYGELFTHYGPVIDEVTSRCEPMDGGCRSTSGDVLMPGSDVTPRGLATASAVMVDGVVLGGDVIVVRPVKEFLCGPFLANVIRSNKSAVLRLVKGSTVYHIHAKDLADLPFMLPPLYEQEAIAEALSDADSAIEALDALIAKKRDVKQAAMQQLLTGRTRLPGFVDEWMPSQISDVAAVNPEALGADTPGDYSFRYISLENTNQGRLLGWSEEEFSSAPSRARRVLRRGDFLFATVRPNLLGHHLLISDESDWVCSTGFAVIRSRLDKCHEGFLAQIFFSREVIDQVDLLISGSNYPSISSHDVGRLRVKMPSRKEQSAIAQFLGDMDEEIEALVAEREKLDLVKQGMMQELLTGRVRLV